MDVSTKQQEFEALKARVDQLETELRETEATGHWPPPGFYSTYHATGGFVMGGLAAALALLVNVIGAPVAGKQSLELIRVYLTFPLGEQALQLADPTRGSNAITDGMILAFGCCLFLFTGMLLGVPLQVVLAKFNGRASLVKRLIIGAVLGLVLWVVNFYGVLSWLQPALFGGNWIVDPQYLPPWVAAGTHIVFGLSMALLYPLAQFSHLQHPAEKS
ncbi:MAG: hypothetical protein JSS02_02765 [Planctomycetes bacterium]|nr:hypothetical protein [Planctomycetota bacterium]